MRKYTFVMMSSLIIISSCISTSKDPILGVTGIKVGIKGKKEKSFDQKRIYGKKEDVRALRDEMWKYNTSKKYYSFVDSLKAVWKNKNYHGALSLIKPKLSDPKWVKEHESLFHNYVTLLFAMGERKKAIEIADSLIATQDDKIRSLNRGMHFLLALDAAEQKPSVPKFSWT